MATKSTELDRMRQRAQCVVRETLNRLTLGFALHEVVDAPVAL
jgi:hypothetical protein